MSKRNRLCTLALAGALAVFGGSLAPDARAAADAPRDGGINVYVQNLKITEVTGSFEFDLRVVLWSTNDWWYRIEGTAPLANVKQSDPASPPPRPYEQGGPTTYHEVTWHISGVTLIDPALPGAFNLRVFFKNPFNPVDMPVTVPSVPDVVETLVITPGALAAAGGSWTQDFSVEFKVDSTKTTLTSDILSSGARLDGEVTANVPGMPAGDTYFFMNFQASGTYPLDPEDPEQEQSALIGVYVPKPGAPAQVLGGLKDTIGPLEF